MKKRITLLLFITIVQLTYAQQSMDSLRLVSPVTSERFEEINFGYQNQLIQIKEKEQIQIWDTKSGKLIKYFSNEKDSIKYSRLSADNKHLLFSTAHNTFLCLISTGEKILNLEGSSAFFSKDEKLIITINENKVFVWDRFNGKKIRTILLESPIFGLSCPNHTTSKLLYVNYNNQLLVADLISGEIELKYKIPDNKFVWNHHLEWSFDDSKILFWYHENNEHSKGIDLKTNIQVIDALKNNILFSITTDGSKGNFYEFTKFNFDGSQILTLLNKQIQIWDINSRKCITKINPIPKYQSKWRIISNVNYSNDGQLILASGDGFCKLFDSNSGRLFKDFLSTDDYIGSSSISSDNKLVIVKTYPNYKIWQVENGILVNELFCDKLQHVESGDVSLSEKYIWSYINTFNSHQVRLFDVLNGNLVKTFDNKNQAAIGSEVFLSNDNKYFIYSHLDFKKKYFKNGLSFYNKISLKTRDMLINIYDTENNSESILETGQCCGNQKFLLFDNNRQLLTWTTGLISAKTIKFWNIENRECTKTIGYEDDIETISISPNNKILAYISFRDSVIKIANIDDFLAFKYLNTSDIIQSIEFNETGDYLHVKGESTNKIWDLENYRIVANLEKEEKKEILIKYGFHLKKRFTIEKDVSILWEEKVNNRKIEFYNLENNNWLVKLPNSPYYMCSKDASKMLHYVTPSLKVIGFEQLDPVYNRPDIVLDSIGKYFGGADQELVANYRQSWEKRIDRLGLDKEKLGKGEIAVPNAEIVGADEIAYESKDGKLEINVSANDSKYPLRRFNVFVNEVPLYGSTGISISHLKKQVWDTTVSVPLSVGDNKIQVSVMNELGLENFKYPTYVNYTPKEEVVSKTYFIGIGVNEFKDATHNLTFCEQDVRDLASAFSGKHTEITLLTNEQVTKEKILSLKELLQKTTVNDKVIISCSSHGLLDDSLNFYLATHDVDFEHPKSRGLRYEELEGLLDGIPARQKLLLLDACNSGENDKLEAGNQVLAQNQATADSTKIGRGAKAKYASTDNQKFIQMNELFVNVRNNTGSVIISAAGGQQSALEGEAVKVDGKAIQNGAFTFSILECLEQNKGKELKVNALKQYAEKRVEEITNGKQKPTSRQETMEIDWDVRKLP